MFTALGVGGGSSLIGGVAVLLACIPFLFYKHGERIRVKSRFAPTGPKKQSDEVNGAEKGAARERHREEDSDDNTAVGDRDESQSTMAGVHEKQHHGDRESMDANPFDYVTDDPNAGHYAEEVSKEKRHPVRS